MTEVTVSLSHDTAVTVSSIPKYSSLLNPGYTIQLSIYHQVSVHHVIPKTPKENNFMRISKPN